MSDFKWDSGATSTLTLLSTELNGLANGALALSSAGGTSGVFNQSSSGSALWAEPPVFTLGGAITTAAAAGGALYAWFLESLTGTLTPPPADFEFGSVTGNTSSGSTSVGSVSPSAGVSSGSYVFDLTNPGNLPVGVTISGGAGTATWTLSSSTGIATHSGDAIAVVPAGGPARTPDLIFPFANRTYVSGERIAAMGRIGRVPAFPFMVLLYHAMGQTLPASGNTLSTGLAFETFA